MKNLICIVCPKGCHLTINENDLTVTGNACEKGSEYAVNELTAPVRMVTSTVCITGAQHRRCPVKTSKPVSKAIVFDAMKQLDKICLTAPVKTGQIAVKSICGTDADFVVTRDMDKI